MAPAIRPGIVLPLMPFLDDKLNYDFSAVEGQVDHAIRLGINGVFVLTTCGQQASFSLYENRELARVVKDVVADRVPVYVGIGRENDPAYTTAMLKHAGRIDATAVVVLCYGMDADQQVAHFRELNQAGFPLVAYTLGDGPKRLQHIEDILALDNVIGAKATIDLRTPGNADYFRRVVNADKPMLMGEDVVLLEGLREGAVGGINAIANLIPEWPVAVYRHWTHREPENQDQVNQVKARQAQDQINQVLAHLYYGKDAQGNDIDGASALQNAMAQVFTFGSPRLREPRPTYSGRDAELIRETLEKAGFFQS